LPVSDGRGGLVLTRAGASRVGISLVEGQNILSADGEFNSPGRFATYVVRGQHSGADDFFGEQSAKVKATATDSNVTRSNRKLLLRPEGNVTVEHAKKRAEWEATTRAARANAVNVTVQGWHVAEGQLWPVNALVKVEAPSLRVSGELLIA